MDLLALNPVILLRTAYLGAAALVLLVSAIPALRFRFLEYGARASKSTSLNGSQRRQQHQRCSPALLSQALDLIASLTVPHDWFISFYVTSVACSLFWASALFSSHSIQPPLPNPAPTPQHSMSFDQITVAWILLFAQGSRRLYECFYISTPSRSRMWIGHWVVGILFYLGTSVAIWIEGTETLKSHRLIFNDFVLTGPSPRTFFATILFILASGHQHDCHEHLASLKKSKDTQDGKSDYQLPKHPAFNVCLTPHYFSECLIYLALAIQAAPAGQWVNWTLACSLCFVLVNLGVTANGTKAWYESKFGVDAVRGRARMIPYLY